MGLPRGGWTCFLPPSRSSSLKALQISLPSPCTPSFHLCKGLRCRGFCIGAEAIRELADFYMKNGQRAAVPRNVVASIRGHLLAAKSVLPEPEKKNFLGF